MTEPTLKKTHDLLEKLAEYVMNEVPTKRYVDKRFDCLEKDVKETKEDVKLILEGMNAQVKQTEILQIEQVAIKFGLKKFTEPVFKAFKTGLLGFFCANSIILFNCSIWRFPPCL